jgi:hypothetical protein
VYCSEDPLPWQEASLLPENQSPLDLKMTKDTPQQTAESQPVLLRLLSFTAGITILGTATWATIDAGSLTGSSASLAVALSLGLAVTAMVLPKVKSKALIAGLSLALFAGEASNLLSVAERVVIQREAVSSKTVTANSTATSSRQTLTRLEAELSAHRLKSVTVVATKDCRSECRQLLEKQTASLEASVSTAKAETSSTASARSATPLADKIGVQAWFLDVLMAVLLSVGSNLLAGFLIMWSTHTTASVTAETLDLTARDDSGNSPVKTDDSGDPIRPNHGGVSETTRGVLKLISASGGTLNDSQRKMARELGLSQGTLNRALLEAKRAGLVECTMDRVTGTKVRVLA